MGLFSNDDTNGRAERLVANAQGNSVTSDRLTTTSTGMMQKDLFADDPLLSHLRPDEQPQYFLYNDTKGITRNGTTVGGGNDASYRSICLVTDQRILFFTDGTKGESLSAAPITTVETKSGHMKHRLTIMTRENEYTFYANNSLDEAELRACGEYIEYLSGATEAKETGEETTTIEGLSGIWAGVTETGPVAEEAMDAEPQGAYVTRENFEKVKSVLDPDEKIHFITRGSTVDVEGSSAGNSLFGDDRSRKSGTKGWVRAIITDKRVAIKVPQVLGTDERSVPYPSITSVDLDTGLVNKRLTLQTAGQTYHIEAHEPDKSEVRQAVRFIREQIAKANQPDVVQQAPESEPDPLDRIEKLQELNETGVISDSEFEEKKQDLLDQV
ncbi:PH domain-containing protein [Haloparvum sp. PAK95]|uniref:PH domain-containing protein n=1 Tax=Haloparvum sp. PAK95 TaxID=3418962 RepID=UPI003D2F39D3